MGSPKDSDQRTLDSTIDPSLHPIEDQRLESNPPNQSQPRQRAIGISPALVDGYHERLVRPTLDCSVVVQSCLHELTGLEQAPDPFPDSDRASYTSAIAARWIIRKKISSQRTTEREASVQTKRPLMQRSATPSSSSGDDCLSLANGIACH